MKYKTLKSKVEWCLMIYPKTRNSDKELVKQVWGTFWFNDLDNACRNGGEHGEHPVKAMLNLITDVLPSAESIRRLRQKFQERGEYLADEAVKEERRKRSVMVQDGIAGRRPQSELKDWSEIIF